MSKTKNIESLSEKDPGALKLYQGLSHAELLEMCCGERLDLLDMNDRVAVFMSECTMNLSYTTYTPEVIRGLISTKQEYDLNIYCKDLADNMTNEEIVEEIKDRANQID